MCGSTEALKSEKKRKKKKRKKITIDCKKFEDVGINRDKQEKTGRK